MNRPGFRRHLAFKRQAELDIFHKVLKKITSSLLEAWGVDRWMGLDACCPLPAAAVVYGRRWPHRGANTRAALGAVSSPAEHGEASVT